MGFETMTKHLLHRLEVIARTYVYSYIVVWTFSTVKMKEQTHR